MSEDLARLLRETRRSKGWSLREVERRTGIDNAHLSQIETGHIARPAMHLLYSLSRLYELDYAHLMRLAGYATDDASADAQTLQGAALDSLSDMSPSELKEVLEFLDQLRERNRRAGS